MDYVVLGHFLICPHNFPDTELGNTKLNLYILYKMLFFNFPILLFSIENSYLKL